MRRHFHRCKQLRVISVPERLDAIDGALEALRDPSYGTCALCGGEIEIARLRLSLDTRIFSVCARGARPARSARAPSATC